MANAELHSTPAIGRTIGETLAAPIRAVFDVLVRMAEASSQIKALKRLSEISDDDLARRGTTRQEQVTRIMGSYTSI